MAPKAGDTISGYEVAPIGKIRKIEDYGHDNSMRYVLENGEVVYACHWDFEKLDDGTFYLKRKSYSNWSS